MSILVLAAVLSVWLGTKLGREIPGTTISGLKIALGFWAAVLGAAIGAVLGLIAFLAGQQALFIGIGSLVGLGAGLVGCAIGALRR